MPAPAPAGATPPPPDWNADPWVLSRYAAWLRIAHHIPGRIRLKLVEAGESGLREGLGEVKRFVSAAAAAPGIRAVNLNLLARSCVVEYDPAQIGLSAWSDLIAGDRSEAALALARRLAGTASCPD